MINKFSVNMVLKSAMLCLAFAALGFGSLAAWNSWSRLQETNRILAITDASGHAFRAVYAVRLDRSVTGIELRSDRQSSSVPAMVGDARASEIALLKTALSALENLDLPDRQATLATLGKGIQHLAELQQESAAAFAQPKSARRPALVDEYIKETTVVSDMLEKLSNQLAQSIKLQDPFIDHMIEVKQLALAVRTPNSEIAVTVANGLIGQQQSADAMLRYNLLLGNIQGLWGALDELASGLPLPPKVAEAIATVKREFFAPDFLALRLKLMNASIAREPAPMKVDDWAKIGISKSLTLQKLAEAASDAARDYASGQHANALWTLSLQSMLLLAVIALTSGVVLVVSRRVTGPLKDIQHAMARVAAGDFDVALPGLDRKDEIGDVANAVERFKVLAVEKAHAEAQEALHRQQAEADRQAETARSEAEAQAKIADERAQATAEQARAVKALGTGLRQLAEGDLTYRLTGEFPNAYQELQVDFNATMDRLQETIEVLVASTREVSNAAAEISSSTMDLSQRTEEQAASLEETSASLEKIAVTVKKNAENAQEANCSASSTQAVADRGGEVVAEAVNAMSRIEESSRKISDIIGVIDEIARQTNLLALNAAVEAARAGEAGRGFAVVASEVRSLAQRSSQAAKDIKDLITNSNSQVQDGVELVNRAGQSLNEIVESIKKVAEIVSDIASASQEQSSGLDQVNKALTQMDEMTQQNSALVEENAATAKTLEHQAQEMDQRVAIFKIGAKTEARTEAKTEAPKPAHRPERSAGVKPASVASMPSRRAPPPAAKMPSARGPVGRMQAALATAIKEDDWSEF